MWIRFPNLVNFSLGKTPERHEAKYWDNGKYPWFSIADMRDKETIFETKEKISEESYRDYFNSSLSPKGTLIMSFKLTVGRVSILGIDAVHNEAIISIFPYLNIENSIRDWLFYTLGIIVTFVEQTNAIKGNTLNKEKMSSMLIPLPPISEQRRIIDKINSFEPLIQEYDKNEKLLTELESSFTEKLKKSILQYAIEGKLVKQDPNDEPASVLLERIKAEKEKLIKEGKIKRDKNESYIYQGDDKNYYENNVKSGKKIDVSSHTYTIPDNWCWCSLSQLCKQITDGTHQTPKYQNDGMPFLSIANISSGFYDNKPKYISCEEHNQLIKRCNPTKNDILMCRIGTLGKPFINDLNFEFSIFVSLALIKPININMSQYLKYVLEAPNTLSYIDFVKVGGGTHTFKINIEDLNTFPIPMPPLNEQNKINKRIKIIFDQINSLLN